MSVEVRQFICLTDNFGLLLRDEATGAVASIDAPDARGHSRRADRGAAGRSPIFCSPITMPTTSRASPG